MKKNNKAPRRHAARCKVMQALYQWDHTGQESAEILLQFLEELDDDQVELGYFTDLAKGVIEAIPDIDELMSSYLDRPITELNPVERAILRLSIYELKHRLDIPYRVVINEALEIGKKYGSDQGHKYINGVLDKLAPRLRPTEVRR